ncbi:hypothetical protein C4K04_2564 [Pseudomonas chlororaphis]|uniref:Uncharacterized protein n=1 Tax=Pseudomonas chlororaphis TaxID=587753 RepID=A0A3G7TMA4_9PSED|nr:hypothetical protein [Pseudomonas chlororaphis]AZE48237.1 hypothetical protein C4K04_2564 [Pseudomonas chlororaphis]
MSIEAISKVGENSYRQLIPAAQRAVAVGAALELIQSRIGSALAGTSLETEMGKLSQYADKIQAALKTAD